MTQVCRTCLEVIGSDAELFSLEINEPTSNTVHIKTKLEACVPEIALHRVKNSVICGCCLGALNAAYDFKSKCLQTETKISEYMTREPLDIIDLSQFIKQNNDLTLQQAAVCHTNETNGKPPAPPPLPTAHVNGASQSIIRSILEDGGKGTLFECPVCRQPFASIAILKEHMNCHVGETVRCPVCSFQTNSKLRMEEHIQTHIGLSTTTQQFCMAPISSSSIEAPFACSDCDYSTSDKTLFAEHRVFHTGERLHHCTLCKFASTHASSLRRHMKVHMGDRPFRCTECRFGASDVNSLRTHMQCHTRERPFKCTHCPYTAVKRAHLQNHFDRVHGDNVPNMNVYIPNPENGFVVPVNAVDDSVMVNIEGSAGSAADPYKVSIADIRSILDEPDNSNAASTISALPDPALAELETASETDPYMVTIADIQEILQNKSSTEPDDGGPETCTNGVSNGHSAKEVEPVRSDVSVDPNSSNNIFRCSFCQQPFASKYLLKRHVSVHVGDAPKLECTICGFRTKVHYHLQAHMKTHSGRKIYSCGQCEYTSLYWSNLQKHRRVHTGERPYKCPYCSYRASQQTSVKNHMSIHTGERQFRCSECPYVADTELVLHSHMEMHAVSVSGHFLEEGMVFMPLEGAV